MSEDLIEERPLNEEQEVNEVATYTASKPMRVFVWFVISFVLAAIVINGVFAMKDVFSKSGENDTEEQTKEIAPSERPNGWGAHWH